MYRLANESVIFYTEYIMMLGAKKYFAPDLISGGSVMFIQILSAIHNAGTLLFGIYCSAFFLGVKSNKKNILSLFLLFCVQGSLYLINSAFFGEALAL